MKSTTSQRAKTPTQRDLRKNLSAKAMRNTILTASRRVTHNNCSIRAQKRKTKSKSLPKRLNLLNKWWKTPRKNVKLPKSGGAQRASSKEADSNPLLSFSLRSLCGLWATTRYLPTCPFIPPRHSTFRQVSRPSSRAYLWV